MLVRYIKHRPHNPHQTAQATAYQDIDFASKILHIQAPRTLLPHPYTTLIVGV